MKVSCPTCKKKTLYEGNEYRPFCSHRCKLLDLGEWIEGKHSIPSQEQLSEEDILEIERSKKDHQK